MSVMHVCICHMSMHILRDTTHVHAMTHNRIQATHVRHMGAAQTDHDIMNVLQAAVIQWSGRTYGLVYTVSVVDSSSNSRARAIVRARIFEIEQLFELKYSSSNSCSISTMQARASCTTRIFECAHRVVIILVTLHTRIHLILPLMFDPYMHAYTALSMPRYLHIYGVHACLRNC